MVSQDIAFRVTGVLLEASLVTPEDARGLVVFAFSGIASRHDARSRRLAELFERRGFATLRVDLVTLEEEGSGLAVEALAARLVGVLDDIVARGLDRGAPLALFGCGIDSAPTLIAAAQRPVVRAIACLGGVAVPPDVLQALRAPTVFIVGSGDLRGLRLSRAAGRLSAVHEVIVVPGVGSHFAEPGALDELGGLATHWLAEQLQRVGRPHSPVEADPHALGG